MDFFEKEYDLIGELADDSCQFLKIHHYVVNRRALRNLIGKKLRIIVKPYKETKSTAQLRYFHLLIGKIREWMQETTGRKHSHAAVYAWVKTSIFGAEPITKKIMGEEVIIMKKINFSKITKDEMKEAIETLKQEMAERGCILPDSTDNNELHEFLRR